MKRTFALILAGFVSINSLSFAVSYRFQGFNGISSDYVFHGMSSNGELLMSNSNGSHLWTHESGINILSGNNFDGIGSISTYSAETVSNGGSVMSGRDISTDTTVLWTPQNGAANLHELMGIEQPPSLRPESISGNGVVVGRIQNETEQGQWYTQAFIYDSQIDSTTILGSTSHYTSAYGISRDETIITGSYEEQPFWWTQEQGIQLMQHPDIPFLQLQNDRVSEIFDISNNGDVIIGWSGSPFEAVATIWNTNGETIILSDEENNSFATSVSGDGEIVVGHEFIFGVPNQRVAFIWDEVNGKRYLNEVLTSGGIDLGGWYLNKARAISSDGSTIIGSGINPDGNYEYWVATIPEPATVALLALGGVFIRRKKR